MSKKNEIAHLEYKMDLMERRLEKIEDILRSHNNQGGNQEVISLLINLLKQQYKPQQVHHQPAQNEENTDVAPVKKEAKQDKGESQPFDLRRLSMVL